MKLLLLAFPLLFCIGCGEKMVGVSGKVTLDGKPIKDCRVLFQPKVRSTERVDASGLTDAEGRYRLTSLGEKMKRGVATGEYVVKFGWSDPYPSAENDTPANPSPYRIPLEVTRDGLSFSVPEGGTDKADFTF